jgi:hypothetical protein
MTRDRRTDVGRHQRRALAKPNRGTNRKMILLRPAYHYGRILWSVILAHGCPAKNLVSLDNRAALAARAAADGNRTTAQDIYPCARDLERTSRFSTWLTVGIVGIAHGEQLV